MRLCAVGLRGGHGVRESRSRPASRVAPSRSRSPNLARFSVERSSLFYTLDAIAFHTKMSAFKRRTTTKQPPLPAGTRTSPGSTATVITSTGIPSLDDILGGGLPLSCSLLVLAPDAHTAYGGLVVKYAAAQGLASGQRVCVVDPRADSFLAECMWMPGSNAPIPTSSVAAPSTAADDEDDERASEHDTKIKIAWRYEQMKQFQTTVPSSNQ